MQFETLSVIDEYLRMVHKKKENIRMVTNLIAIESCSVCHIIILFNMDSLLREMFHMTVRWDDMFPVLQLVIDSPVSPVTSILPLMFVVTVTAFKQVCK